ncbi:MAG: molybdopterin-dependent oxidoreductase [Alphaproteobacteria bacterium]|nr:molybdopterin-dependent oxidoreductase [Alphaproteobacteria bacterium]
MSCNSCKSGSSGLPRGCNNNGNCSSGSCGTFTVFDWLSDISNSKINPFKIVEVRFKNGRKGYYRNNELNVSIGDTIITESEKGYDIGSVTLTGELVRIQLKKKGINIDDELYSLKRFPNEKEISKWKELMRKESEIQVRARIIAIDLGLKMKISDVEFQADGTAVIYASQQDNGQAHRTTLTQIFSHQLGYDVDKIKIVQGDSLRTPAGTTGGARMSAVMGSTLSQAADLIAEKARPFAAEHLEANSEDIQFAEGIFSAAGTNRSIEIEELVGLLATDNPAEHPLNQVHEYTTKGASYPYGCHIVELEVDMATLQPKILRYTVVDDIGNIINPLTFAGQIHGGIAQGVGQALYEHVAFDEDGQLLAGSLMDYTLPRADHLPSFSINTRNTVCQNNVLGVKGVGEAGAIGAPPAVISALCDALDIVHIEMPATLQAIWQVMKPKKEAG